MPNIKGLRTAAEVFNDLADGASDSYGSRCVVTRTGSAVTIGNGEGGSVLATVDFTNTVKPSVKARLALIDETTATPVNAFLRDYGTTKINWRTNVREWKPRSQGHLAPAAVVEARPKTVAATATAITAPEVVATTVEERQPIKIVLGSGFSGQPGGVTIPTERVWSGKGKTPSVKRLTKTWSRIGSVEDGVLLPTRDVTTLEIALKLRQAGRPAAVLITGPAGTAKTKLAEQFAFSKGLPFLLVEGASIQTAADWFGGFIQNANGTWEWRWTDFGLALLRGEPMVILVDEINRPENERALNGLMGLLAWTATTQPLGAPQPLHLAPGILIMATLNEGVEYVGTVEVDAAVRDRFPWGVRMDYSVENIEAKVLTQHVPGLDDEVAKRLVRIAAGQRAKRDDDMAYPSHNVISTRTLIEIGAAIVECGVEPVEAIWASLRSKFIREDEPALTVLIEAQFGATPEALDESIPDDENLESMMTAQDD